MKYANRSRCGWQHYAQRRYDHNHESIGKTDGNANGFDQTYEKKSLNKKNANRQEYNEKKMSWIDVTIKGIQDILNWFINEPQFVSFRKVCHNA